MTQVAAALISGVVALLIGGASALLTLSQIRKEHRRWLADLKTGWSLELYKARMETYPNVQTALAPCHTPRQSRRRPPRWWHTSLTNGSTRPAAYARRPQPEALSWACGIAAANGRKTAEHNQMIFTPGGILRRPSSVAISTWEDLTRMTSTWAQPC